MIYYLSIGFGVNYLTMINLQQIHFNFNLISFDVKQLMGH